MEPPFPQSSQRSPLPTLSPCERRARPITGNPSPCGRASRQPETLTCNMRGLRPPSLVGGGSLLHRLADRLRGARTVVHNHVGQGSTYALGTVSVSWSHATMHGPSRFDGLRMEQSRLPRQRDRYCTAGQASCATSHILSTISTIDKTESHPLAATHLRSWSPTCGLQAHQPSPHATPTQPPITYTNTQVSSRIYTLLGRLDATVHHTYGKNEKR